LFVYIRFFFQKSKMSTEVFTQWAVVNTVIVVIVLACAVGIAGVVLLICVGAKRRNMSVRNQLVPIWSQNITRKQKREILAEHDLEVNFQMAPVHDPNETLDGWFSSRHEALGEDLTSQLEQLKQEVEIAAKESRPSKPNEPRVLSICVSRHPEETHVASLMVQSVCLIEKHAVAVAPQLAKEAMQDVPAYIKVTLSLSFFVCLFNLQMSGFAIYFAFGQAAVREVRCHVSESEMVWSSWR
jgi:hypothetical protein